MRSKTTKGTAEYLQLCHNEYDRKTKRSKTNVVYNFGRADELDVASIRRLIKSLSRLLPSEEHSAVEEATNSGDGVVFVGSRQLGGTWMLDKLWERLGIRDVIRELLSERSYQTPIERLLFAMVANRALAPSSKLFLEHWVANEVYVRDLPSVDVHQLYRAMDFLLDSHETIQEQVYCSVANLLNLEVDLLFLDTTTTYFEVEKEDADDDEEEGFRKRGYGKDNHPELPQVVIAFAVTRDGIPVRCWVWPGNTSDQDVVEEVKSDLSRWKLGRVIMVQDTGFNSAENRRTLQRAGGHYIIGEKMRLGPNGKSPEALKQRGRYQTMESGLEYKESIVGGDGEARRRFVIVRNPDEAERDREKRTDIVKAVETRLDDLKQLEGEPHRKVACKLRSHPVFGRYVRQTKTGRLLLNKGKIRLEEHLDGKYLISTSDDSLTAEDVVLGYKQLSEVERVFRDLKHTLELRPVRHRLSERIRAHVLLCWLGMLLIRVAETETENTWFQIKKTLANVQLGVLELPDGVVHQSSKLTNRQKRLYKQLKADPPPKFFSLNPSN